MTRTSAEVARDALDLAQQAINEFELEKAARQTHDRLNRVEVGWLRDDIRFYKRLYFWIGLFVGVFCTLIVTSIVGAL